MCLPPPSSTANIDITFLWARTVICPYCDGLVPLSPNWRLTSSGVGVRLVRTLVVVLVIRASHCTFEMVDNTKDQSAGDRHGRQMRFVRMTTVDLSESLTSEEIKRQAQAGRMGEQLYAVVYKRRVKNEDEEREERRYKWVRGYRRT